MMHWSWATSFAYCYAICAWGLFVLLISARVEDSMLRRRFREGTALVTAYAVLLVLFHVPGLELSIRHQISMLIFISGVLSFVLPLIFWIRFAQYERYPVFAKLVLLLAVFALVAVLAGYVTTGVEIRNGVYKPIYGPLQPLISVAGLACGISIWWIAAFRSRELEIDLAHQVRVLGSSHCATVLLMVSLNAIILPVLGRTDLTPISALSLLGWWSVVLYFLVFREVVFAIGSFVSLLKVDIVRMPGGGRALSSHLEALGSMLTHRPQLTERAVEFPSGYKVYSGTTSVAEFASVGTETLFTAHTDRQIDGFVATRSLLRSNLIARLQAEELNTQSVLYLLEAAERIEKEFGVDVANDFLIRYVRARTQL